MESEPSPLFADTIEPVRRSKPSEVFYLRMEACPNQDSEEFGTVGGAYVNCYVDADDLRSAEIRAIELLHEENWQPLGVDDWSLTSLDQAASVNPPEDPDATPPRELVRQALEDGEACEFHCWPADEDHGE